MSRQPRDGFLATVRTLLEILVVSLFIVTFIVQPFRIPSESMEPTLRVGDFLLVQKQNFAPGGVFTKLLPPEQIHRGDPVVFHYPVDPGMDLVKRVIGLPGDHLHLRHNQVFIDGVALTEPYAFYLPSRSNTFRDNFPSLREADPNVDARWWLELRRSIAGGDLVVPADHYFVLGDNRNDSEDSRYWGFVPREAIVGRPLLVYFSLRDEDATGAFSQRLQRVFRNSWHSFRVVH